MEVPGSNEFPLHHIWILVTVKQVTVCMLRGARQFSGFFLMPLLYVRIKHSKNVSLAEDFAT